MNFGKGKKVWISFMVRMSVIVFVVKIIENNDNG